MFSSFLQKIVLQVWALAIGKKTEMFATGGGDAVVNLWYDSTASDKEEAFRKEVSISDSSVHWCLIFISFLPALLDASPCLYLNI